MSRSDGLGSADQPADARRLAVWHRLRRLAARSCEDPLPLVARPRLPRPLVALSIVAAAAAIRLFVLYWASPSDLAVAESWARWDAVYYVNLARHGYLTDQLPADQLAFMSRFPPLYPALIAFCATFPGVSPLIAGIGLAIGLSALAALLLYALVQVHTGDWRPAAKAALLMSVFPTSYFGNAPYSEGLFLFLSLLYFWVLVRFDSYGGASAAACGMVLTRTIGIVILVPHAFLALCRWRARGYLRGRDLAYLVLPAAAFLGQQAALIEIVDQPGYFHGGDAAAFKYAAIPFSELLHRVSGMVTAPQEAFSPTGWMTTTWSTLFLLAAALVAIPGVRLVSTPYALYLAAQILVLASMSWAISLPRMVWPLFPLFMILGRIENRWVLAALVVCFAAALLQFSAIFTAGLWAF